MRIVVLGILPCFFPPLNKSVSYKQYMKLELLGGISPEKFLRDYWQKKPLAVRGALPGFQGFLTRDDLIQLACRDDAQSRLITRKRAMGGPGMGLSHLAFFPACPKKQWTLLVQDVNHFLPSARELLLKFNFIPLFPAG